MQQVVEQDLTQEGYFQHRYISTGNHTSDVKYAKHCIHSHAANMQHFPQNQNMED